MTDVSLSSKIETSGGHRLNVTDVKEFILKLKKSLREAGWDSLDPSDIDKRINELAGEELIK